MSIQLQSGAGAPVTIGDVTVTPWSQALIVRLPFGGLVWNRPTAVVVERDGQVERVSILDVTRVLQVGIVVLGVAMAIGASSISSRKSEVSSNEE